MTRESEPRTERERRTEHDDGVNHPSHRYSHSIVDGGFDEMS